MAEGRVRNEGGGFGLVLKMEYFITDQQGNVRVSFEDNNGTVALIQENSYYAFGMQMAGGYTPTSNPNKKLYNAGSEWQDDIDGLADYYSTFFREYDPIIGRFNGVDPMALLTESISTYAYANNNPILFNDPMGNAVNPAQFKTARELLEYVEKHGIGDFDSEYIRWSWAAEDLGTGGVPFITEASKVEVKYDADGTPRGISFSFSGYYANGKAGEFGNPNKPTTLDQIFKGKKFISARSLAIIANEWGETHRQGSIDWFGGKQYFDVTDRPNYSLFRERMGSGTSLSQKGDRASYTEGLGNFKRRYAAEQDARNFEAGFLGVMFAPLAILTGAELFPFLAEGAGAIDVFAKEAGIKAYEIITTGKHAVVDFLGGVIVEYGPESMVFSGGLYTVVNAAHGLNLNGPVLYQVVTTIAQKTGLIPSGALLPKY